MRRRFKRFSHDNSIYEGSKFPFGTDAPLLVLLRFPYRTWWTLEIINKILGNFQRTAGLFSHTLYTKLFALVLLSDWRYPVFSEFPFTKPTIINRYDIYLYFLLPGLLPTQNLGLRNWDKLLTLH